MVGLKNNSKKSVLNDYFNSERRINWVLDDMHRFRQHSLMIIQAFFAKVLPKRIIFSTKFRKKVKNS